MDNAIQDAKNQAQADVLKIVDAACIDEQYTPEKRRLLRNVAITGADMGFVAGMEFAISQISQHLSGKAGACPKVGCLKCHNTERLRYGHRGPYLGCICMTELTPNGATI